MCKLKPQIKEFLNSDDIKPLLLNKKLYSLKEKEFLLKILDMFITFHLGTEEYNDAIKEGLTDDELCLDILEESSNIVRYNNNYQQALKEHINPELYCYLREGRRKISFAKEIPLSNIFTNNSLKLACKNFENNKFEFNYNKEYIYKNKLNEELYERIYRKFINKGKQFFNYKDDDSTTLKEFKSLVNNLSDFCSKHKDYHIKIEIDKSL